MPGFDSVLLMPILKVEDNPHSVRGCPFKNCPEEIYARTHQTKRPKTPVCLELSSSPIFKATGSATLCVKHSTERTFLALIPSGQTFSVPHLYLRVTFSVLHRSNPQGTCLHDFTQHMMALE